MDKALKSIYAESFATVLQQQHAGIGSAKAALRRFLKSVDTVGWSRREESGRIDRRALTRFATGDANIFSRREVAECETSAVSILVDLSGSTDEPVRLGSSTKRSWVFRDIAVHLSKLISDVGCTVAVNGFYGTKKRDNIGLQERVIFTELKGFGESITAAAPAIAAIPQLVAGSTPEFNSIKIAIEQVAARPERRKVLFILTDADAFNLEAVKHLDEVAKKLGVVVVAIGCGNAPIEQCFTNSARVNTASELFTSSFTKLLHSLKEAA